MIKINLNLQFDNYFPSTPLICSILLGLICLAIISLYMNKASNTDSVYKIEQKLKYKQREDDDKGTADFRYAIVQDRPNYRFVYDRNDRSGANLAHLTSWHVNWEYTIGVKYTGVILFNPPVNNNSIEMSVVVERFNGLSQTHHLRTCGTPLTYRRVMGNSWEGKSLIQTDGSVARFNSINSEPCKKVSINDLVN